MSERNKISRIELMEMLSYDYLTGVFTWNDGFKNSRGNGNTGSAGHLNKAGYIYIRIKGVNYPAHHLAWLYFYGRWPAKLIDHVNGNSSDNRIENLREADHLLNNRNSKISKANTSGVKGVYWNRLLGKWHGRVRVKGKNIHIGVFDDIELAELAMSEARVKYHKEFARDR